MFYPPSLLDLTPAPKPVPIYDTPIVDRQPLRALAARVARGAWRRRTPETCRDRAPESSF
jgi:hypothetical protein